MEKFIGKTLVTLERVSEHARRLEEDIFTTDLRRPTRIFTALQGSQNYDLDDETSDVDTKTLVVPSLESLIFDVVPLSQAFILEPSKEQSDVKDIREMFKQFRKQNTNYLEILFSKYVDVAEGFEEIYNTLHDNREAIAHMNFYLAIRAASGHMTEKYHAFDHPYPASMGKIKRFGYDPKQLHHQLRFKQFIENYIHGYDFETCLKVSNPEEMLAIKRGLIPLEEARILREDLEEWNRTTMAQYTHKEHDTFDLKMEKLLADLTLEAFEIVYKKGK